MNSNRIMAMAALAAVAGMGEAQAQTFALNDALASAYSSNPKLEAERASLRATDEEVSKALSGWKPNISVTGSYGYTENTVGTFLPIPDGHPQGVTVTLAQPIFNGTTVPLTRKAKAEVRAGQAQLASVEQGVLLDAAKAYFGVVTNQAILNLRRENVSLLTNQLQMAQQRFAARDTTRTDVQLVESRLHGAEADAAAAQSLLMSARAEFQRVIGRPADTLDLLPALPDIPADHDQAMARVLASNPDLISAKEQARAADADVAAAVDSFLPSVSLQAQYQTSRDMIGVGISNDSTAVMAQVKVPIYQAGMEYASTRQLQQKRAQAEAGVNDVQGQVQAIFESNWAAETAARQAIDLHKQQVTAAQAAYDGYAEGVKAGENSTYDLMNSAQEVLGAKIALAQALQQADTSRMQVLVSMGALTARGLRLPATLYDPNVYYDRNAGSWIGFSD